MPSTTQDLLSTRQSRHAHRASSIARPIVAIGSAITCHETGETFIAAQDGVTFNYATDIDGHAYSDKGVDLSERRQLLDRSKAFCGYLSSDARSLTGWKGNVLGTVVARSTCSLNRWSHLHGSTILAVTIRDVHGGLWYGRGSASIAIRLRPSKP